VVKGRDVVGGVMSGIFRLSAAKKHRQGKGLLSNRTGAMYVYERGTKEGQGGLPSLQKKGGV